MIPRRLLPDGVVMRLSMMRVGLGAIAWVAVTGMAIACFARVLPPDGPLLFQRELLGFASAFAVGGAVSGSISVAIYGRRGLACMLLATIVAILAISVVPTRWGIARLTLPNVTWFDNVWAATRVSVGFGMAIGGFAGVAASGIVAAFASLTRRRISWTIGLAVATLLAGMGLWVLPHLIPPLSDRMIAYAHWHIGSSYDEAIRGACVGAGAGGLVGAVVMILVARDSSWRGDAGRPDRVGSEGCAAGGGC